MPQPFKYTSIKRIFAKIERDFDITSFNEFDLIEWTGEALEQIGSVNQYEDAVAFIEVKNHQCLLPTGLVNIIQVAKNNCFNNDDLTGTCPSDVVACVPNPVPTGLSPVMVDSCGEPTSETPLCPVLIDCHGTPITDVEVAYYRPFFDLQADYFGWCNCSLYKTCFSPIRLSSHTMFNSLVYRLDTEETATNIVDDVYRNIVDEYQVIGGEMLRFSFRCGQVALAYKRIKLDSETGYPMMPDLVSVTEAVTNYIIWKLSRKDFYKNREGATQRMNESEKQWVWYCRQAGNQLTQLYGVDDYQDMLDQWKYLVPQKDRYFGFFGKLNKPENTLQYDDPDNRNSRGGYNMFRGAFMG